MIGLLIPVAILAFALNGAITRLFQVKFEGKRGLLRVYQALFCFAAAIFFAVTQWVRSGTMAVTASELICGVLFGVFFYLAVVCSANGYEIGSMSLTFIIENMSLFIPVLYSLIIFGDKLNYQHVIGMVLIAATFILAVDKNTGDKKKGALVGLWFINVFVAFFANGITAVIQKMYATSKGSLIDMIQSLFGGASNGNESLFMAIAYLTAAILFVFNTLLTTKKTGEKLMLRTPMLLPAAILSGGGSFLGNALLGVLCDQVNGVVLYPCFNGGLCIAGSLISFIFFKESISKRKLTAIFVGIAAIVLLSLNG